jgi:hypothetical protein
VTLDDVKKSDLTKLQPMPVLFHSGYLTINTISKDRVLNPKTKKTRITSLFKFKLPNEEVESSYYKDCFDVIFDPKSFKYLKTKGEELKKAFLSKDATTVSAIIGGYLSLVNTRRSTDDEKTFQSIIYTLLLGMGFDVLSEIQGANKRLDLTVRLPNEVDLIIELKYRPEPTKPTRVEADAILADIAKELISIEDQDQILASAAKRDIGDDLIYPILRQATGVERTRLLADLALKSFNKAQVNKVLAAAAREKLSPEVIEKALKEAAKDDRFMADEIGKILSKAAKDALNGIGANGYGDLIKHKSQKIIKLGLAVYGYGNRVKALFE